MEKLDQLIAKFKEMKEELEKNSPSLHDTVEGFMGGLKALPKGSPERGEFIVNHLSHGPFTAALDAHPQSTSLKNTLQAAKTAHLKTKYSQQGDAGVKAQYQQLNSKANVGLAGPKKISVGSESASFGKSSEAIGQYTMEHHNPKLKYHVQHHGDGKFNVSLIHENGEVWGSISGHHNGDKVHLSNKQIHPDLVGGYHEDETSEGLTGAAHLHALKSPVGKPMPMGVQGKAPEKLKMSVDADPVEELEKYISPFTLFGSSKKKVAAKPAEAPKSTKLTGSDKIKAVAQEKIQPTSVKHDPSKVKGAPKPFTPSSKLTGIDKIKAVSQEKIHPTSIVADDQKRAKAMGAPTNPNVKKDEDEDKEDLEKGLFSPKAEAKKPFTPSFKGHSAALGVGSKTNAAGVTTERSFDPLKQQTSQKKYVNVSFSKTINSSYAPATNSSSGMAMSADEKLTLNKGGQWNLEKGQYPEPKFKVGDMVEFPHASGYKLEVIDHPKWNFMTESWHHRVKIHDKPYANDRSVVGHLPGHGIGDSATVSEHMLQPHVGNQPRPKRHPAD